MHKGKFEQDGIQNNQPSSETDGKYHRWPSDSIPKSLFHNFVLSLKCLFNLLLFATRFNMIDEQADNVKKTCKPGHHKNDMKSLYDQISHTTNVNRQARLFGCFHYIIFEPVKQAKPC